MNSIINKLKTDLELVIQYWQENVVPTDNLVYAEVSCDDKPNKNADLGSMYLSRIIYGVSAASKSLQTDRYRYMADVSFNKLQKELKNPAGGYLWAVDSSGNALHDADNINMAQAFVLYGLAEYYSLTSSEQASLAITEQMEFIFNTIYDKENGGFYDGFNSNWVIEGEQTRFFGTHLHLLEAFTKLFLCSPDFIDKKYIEQLLEIILNYFIEKGANNRIHQLSYNWQPMKNTVWAGHDAEYSWILCQSARAINHKILIEKTKSLALSVMNKNSELAIDNIFGGAFNEMADNKPAEKQKMWWPQAEMALGFFNCHAINGDDKFLQAAISQINYINDTFVCESGEWFAAVSTDGTPDYTIPKVNFWKSLYHNVRFYVDAIKYLEEINESK